MYHQAHPAGDATGPAIAAVSLEDGSERERYDLDHPDTVWAGPFLSIAGGSLFAVTWTRSDALLDVVDVAGGDVLTAGESGTANLSEAGVPAVAGGSVFLGEGTGSVLALR